MSPAQNVPASPRVALIFSGGIGLGAYQAGAYAGLHENATLHPQWIAAASVGAVNAALIAGNPPEQRVARLQQFWATNDPSFFFNQSLWGAWPHLHNWMSVARARLFGVPGHFHPRFAPTSSRPSLYDLSPMRDQLQKLVDFGRLNSGDIRVTVAATDLESGEQVLFDTAEGTRIDGDHIAASCGLIPDFPPVEIDGRLLGDAALAANAPLEALLNDGATDDDWICFLVDLYARDGERPTGLEDSLTRRGDLIFANQTYQRLRAYQREEKLRARLRDVVKRLPAEARKNKEVAALTKDLQKPKFRMLHLSYRPSPDEAGPEKSFDLSPKMITARWRAGALDMQEAISLLSQHADRDDEAVVSVRRKSA